VSKNLKLSFLDLNLKASAGLKVSALNITLFFLGSALNCLSYLSVAPLLVAVFFYFVAFSFLAISKKNRATEGAIFSRLFFISFVTSGVAAIYTNQLFDTEQLVSDAGGFFTMSAFDSIGLTIYEIQVIHDGSFAIYLYRCIYDFFSYLGFEKHRYIGIIFNSTVFSITGVIGIKIVKKIFGDDGYRIDRFKTLISFCGIFWLFSSLHLRDSLIFFFISYLFFLWVKVFAENKFRLNIICAISISFLVSFIFVFLRGEFVLVPIVISILALGIYFYYNMKSLLFKIICGFLIIFGVVIITLAYNYLNELSAILSSSREAYYEGATASGNLNSLGTSLILSQPILIRIPFGIFYVFIFPIPLWTGFQLNSAYALFKSLNAIYFYFLLPLIVMSITENHSKKYRTQQFYFLVIAFLIFLVAVVITSLETRHLGVFLMPILIISLVPDLRIKSSLHAYKCYLTLVLISILVVHLIWFTLKLIL